MAKRNKIARMQSPPAKEPRGRTARTIEYDPDIGEKGAVKQTKRTETSRPTGKSSTRGGKNRGDRRDMSATYSGTARHAARGNTPRRDVSTRAR
jgi:hypothetical protein